MNWNRAILPKLTPQHRRAFKYNLAAQCVLLFFASLVLDEGFFGATSLIVVLAYWLGVLMILRRRYPNLVPGDLLFFRWGFLAAALLGAILCWIVIASRYR